MATGTRIYTWAPASLQTLNPHSSNVNATWVWGQYTIPKKSLGGSSTGSRGLATNSSYNNTSSFFGEYCTITGDTAPAKTITSIKCRFYWETENGTYAAYSVLGNGGNTLQTVAHANDWIGDQWYERTVSNLSLSGDFLNKGIYGVVAYSTASSGRIELKDSTRMGKLTITYEIDDRIKYWNGTTWDTCIVNYWDGTGWKVCKPYYYTGAQDGWKPI